MAHDLRTGRHSPEALPACPWRRAAGLRPRAADLDADRRGHERLYLRLSDLEELGCVPQSRPLETAQTLPEILPAATDRVTRVTRPSDSSRRSASRTVAGVPLAGKDT